MKGFDVLHVKSAVKARNKMSDNYSHLTTMEIGQVVPLSTIDVIAGDEFDVTADYFSRLAPLVKPTYGKFQFKTLAGFVPYHMIAADAEPWLAGKTTWEGYTPVHRYFTMLTLFNFLTQSVVSTTTGATQQNCDFTAVNANGNRTYYLLTNKGKFYVKVLNALGYAIPSGVDVPTSSAWRQTEAPRKLSAYPLLCFFKLYNDYMSQSQRFNTSQLSNILNAIKYSKAYSGIWNESTGEILAGGIVAMFSALVVNYENDYFTSAWQSPNAPLAASENITSVAVPASNGVVISDTLNDQAAGLPSTGVNAILPQRVLDFLKSFDKWVKRNNYSGSRSVQQVFSRFGIKTSDYRDHYANVFSVESFPIQVGDVTSQSDATGATLGDYAGKGILSGNQKVHFKADDHGVFFILGFITVTTMNPYGFDRRVLRTAPLDYYNPEFDGLGADAISVGEYYADPLDETGAVLDSSTFGFTERYNAYRYMRDVITGDFRNYRNNADMNVWHSGRNLSSVRAAGQLLAQNSAVNTLSPTDSEYNRIFSNTSGNVDHFYMTCQFKVDAVRPMLNLNQVVDLGEGNLAVPRNGNVVS